METQHFLGKVAVKALVTRDGQVLLTRNSQDSDLWEIPGGRLHVGETPEQCLQRELREELGVDLKINRLVHSEQYHQNSDGSLHLLLAYEVPMLREVELRPDPQEVAEMKWIVREQIDDQKIFGNCLNAIKACWK